MLLDLRGWVVGREHLGATNHPQVTHSSSSPHALQALKEAVCSVRNGPPARLRGVRQGQNSNLLPRVSRIGNGSVLGASAAADSVNCPCQFPTHDDADGYRRDRGSNLSRLSNGFRGSAAIPSARRGAHIELPENELERLNSEGNEGSRGVIRIRITQPLHCPRGHL